MKKKKHGGARAGSHGGARAGSHGGARAGSGAKILNPDGKQIRRNIMMDNDCANIAVKIGGSVSAGCRIALKKYGRKT